MLRHPCWLAAAMLLAAVLEASVARLQAQEAGAREIVVTAETADVMGGQKVLGRVKQGQRLTVLATNGPWYQIQLPGQTQRGWIHRDKVRAAQGQGSAPRRLTAQQQARLDEAARLNEQVVTLYGQGRYADAAPLAKRMLAINQQVLGEKHEDSVSCLNNLAALYDALGDYEQAEPLYRQAVAIRRETLGEKHPDYALSLNNLAMLRDAVGDFGEAETLYRQALAIRAEVLGNQDPAYATTLNNLAGVYKQTGEYVRAEPLLREAAAVYRKAGGERHEDYALALNNLATVHDDLGDHARAEALYLEALGIFSTALGEDHPQYATCQSNLATLYKQLGDYARAEPLLRQALASYETRLGRRHPSYATALNNLATVRHDQRDLAEAEQLYRQAIDVYREVYGQGHPATARGLNNLALVLKARGEFQQAGEFLQEALKLGDAAATRRDPAIISSLNNLAAVYDDEGRLDEAEATYRQALARAEEVLGAGHPLRITSLHNLALVQAAGNRWADAAASTDLARRAFRRYVDGVLPSLSESRQLLLLQAQAGQAQHAALSLALAQPEDAALAERSANWLINGKGLAQEALAEQVHLALAAADPDLVEDVRQLRSIRTYLAKRTVTPPAEGDLTMYMGRLAEAEQALSRKIAQARGETPRADPWVELADVRAALATDEILIEIARVAPFDFAARGEDRQSAAPRYAAWLVPATDQGQVRLVDLGEAAAIEDAVAAFRQAMRAAQGTPEQPGVIHELGEAEAEQELRKSLDRLATLLLAPLAPHVEGAAQWTISPDAALWLAPWAALPNPDGTYVVEQRRIRYLVSGRDVLARGAAAHQPTVPLVLADPDYDLVQLGATPGVAPANETELRGTQRAGAGIPVNWPRLPGTAAEARAIEPSLAALGQAAPLVLLGSKALEAAVQQARHPRLLVLSTHGYFLPDQASPLADRFDPFDAGTPADTALVNPLLRCGLVLAGANSRGQRSDESTDDGILTGLEIVGADLRGTELVVLSACETGLGDVRVGEGVAGLRQAFQLAGAKSVVATLWQIPDQQSAQLMADFFARLAEGQSKADALREAQVSMIRSRREQYGAAHPFFWAAFTLTGDR